MTRFEMLALAGIGI